MSGEKRRDFRRFATAALAFSTLALVYYHFVTREKALADARRAIGKIHEQVRNKVDDEVKDLQRDLNLWIGDNWTSEKPWPARFTRVGTHSERLQTLKEHSFGGEKFWVDTDTTQTDVLQEVAREIGPADGGRFGVALALPGPGTATVEVRAQIVSESPPVPNLVLLQVKIRRGPIDPVPIDAGAP